MRRKYNHNFPHRQRIALPLRSPAISKAQENTVTSSESVMKRVYGSRVIRPLDPRARSFRGIILPPRTRIGALFSGAGTV